MATSPKSSGPNALLRDQVSKAPAEREHLPRIAVVCDLAEENWPSMDIVPAMLLEQLQSDYASELSATRLRPPMRRRLTRLQVPGCASLFFNADRLMNRFADYPSWLRGRISEFDLFHITDHSYSQLVHILPAERTIVTCHDLCTFRCLLDPDKESRSFWFRAMAARILNGLKRAAHVITVSAATRDELIRYRLLPAERITVIHNGVDAIFTPVPDPVADLELARLLPADFKRSFCLLNVGSVVPRKRIDLLLKVFAAVRREIPDVRLLRIGEPFTPAQLQLARELGVENAVSILSNVPRAILAAAYRRADLLVHAAETEGFGLTVIEALASGCPVVASDIAALREVGGPAATYCRVADLDQWKQTVIALLRDKQQDCGEWKRRSKQGIARAAGFSWAENARKTVDIYKAVLRNAAAH